MSNTPIQVARRYGRHARRKLEQRRDVKAAHRLRRYATSQKGVPRDELNKAFWHGLREAQ